MNFKEIVELMKQGKKVRRESDGKNYYIKIVDDVEPMMVVVCDTSIYKAFSVTDFEATIQRLVPCTEEAYGLYRR